MKKYSLICLIILFSFLSSNSNKNLAYNGVSFFTNEISLSIPLIDRIQMASDDVINWLISYDLSNTYKPYTLTDLEKELFTEYYNLLPEKLRNIMYEKVICIFFIEGFEGSGMVIADFDNKEKMFVVSFLNPDLFRYNLTEWLSLRENSVFDDNSDISIFVEISDEYSALLFALLHEASHVYDYYNQVTPFVEARLQNNKSPVKTNFTDGVWVNHSQAVSGFDFPYRSELYAWGLGAVLDKTLAMGIYRNLSKTPFTSIYGSQNWAEDFSETFTWFYLTNYLNCSYRIIVTDHNSLETFVYEPLLNLLQNDRLSDFKMILR